MNPLRYLVGPVPLCALGASVITAVATGLWPVVLLGCGAVLVIGSLDYLKRREETQQHIKDQTIVDSVMSNDPARLDPELREQFQAILNKKEAILEVLGSLSGNGVIQLDQIPFQVGNLVDSYYQLSMRIGRAKPFICSGVIKAIEAEIRQIEDSLSDCDDDVMRQNLSMALENKKDERDRIVELRKDRKRIEAQLLNVAAALQNIYVRLMHFTVSPADFDSMMKQEITDEIEDLIREVRISENVAKQLRSIVDERMPRQR